MNIILTNNELQYFLCHINKDDTLFSCQQTEIAKNAFKNDSTLNIFYRKIEDKANIKINESAFENCENLSAVIFANANLEKSEDLDINTMVLTTSTGSEQAASTTADKITIQYHAFKDCENLHTVVLPKFNSLIIEKEAFANCKNLRSIVLMENVVSTGSTTESVSISEEAFSNCSDLNFICIKDGKIARYARENNFKVVAIDE